jgi:hypothetical protein
MRRALPLALGLALVGCGKEPTVVPVRNLERPADMGFVCMRVVDPGNGAAPLVTGRPMRDCHPHLDEHVMEMAAETIDPNVAPRRVGTFGLVTQTARGELGVIDMDAGRLVDLDRTLPGFNMLPVGEFPEVMTASQDGCLVATANRGSCDLAVVDAPRLLAGAFGAGVVPSTGTGAITSRVIPTTASGRALRAAPHEIAFLPQPAADLPTYAPRNQPALPPMDAMCQTSGAFNQSTGQRAPWRAVVTFPSCDLVAVLELPSGVIVSSVYVRPTGVVDAGTEPVCPSDCGIDVTPQLGPDAASPIAPDASADALMTVAPDAALALDAPVAVDAAVSADGAAPADAGAQADRSPVDVGGPRIPGGAARTSALVIRPEGNRLYVGGGNDVYITAIDIADGKLQVAANGGRIPLHDGAGGVRRLRLSLEPFTVFGGKVGRFLGVTEEKQYLYAFAVDDSIRVVDVNPINKTFEHECDVNVDPQFIPPTDPQYVAGTVPNCYALFDDPAHPPARRRAFARGPGLRIPNIANANQAPPVPQDIAFNSQREVTPASANTAGDFGYIVASDINGVYVLNVDSLQAGTMSPVDNSYRDFNFGPVTQTPGPAAVLVQPARDLALTDVPLPTRVPLDTIIQGPRIEGQFLDANMTQLTWVVFPDPTAANSQPWRAFWEGPLTQSTSVHGAALPPGPGSPAGSLLDLGQEFCQQGVLPKDVVLLNGCIKDTDCATDGSLVCRQSLPGTPGLCFSATLAKDSALLTTCARHLATRRRYEVASSTPTRLELALKPDELPKAALDRCQTDDDCRRAPYNSVLEGFSCLQVRKDEPKRCVKPCTGTDGAKDDKLCRAGTVCEQIDDALTGPLCVEGPKIDPACWPAGAAYEVQAGQSFLVVGGFAPRPATARLDDASGKCVADTARNPLLVNRIPLDAPHCTNVLDYQVLGPDGKAIMTNPDNSKNAIRATVPAGPPGTWGNPCLFWGINNDDHCSPLPPSATPPADCNCEINPMTGRRPDTCHVKALFQNSELRFLMTNLEQFVGDANTSRFDVTGGFTPDNVRPRDDILVTMGVRVVTGPIFTPESSNKPKLLVHYLYLLDQGRTGASATGRGQVLRINPRYGTYGVPQFDSNYSPFPFQIQ